MEHSKFISELQRLEREDKTPLNIDEREALHREFKSICVYNEIYDGLHKARLENRVAALQY